MQYKCSQCGHLSSEPGNCPMCGVPMVPVAEGQAPAAPTPPEALPADEVAPPFPPPPPEGPPPPSSPPPPAGGAL